MLIRRIRVESASSPSVFCLRASALCSSALLLALAVACSNAPGASRPSDSSEPIESNAATSKRVVGYLPNYRGALSDWAKKLDFSALTHVNLAFATIETSGGELAIHYRADGATSGEEPGLETFLTAAHAKNVAVCLSIGGYLQRDTLARAIIDTPEKLAEKLASYVETQHLDCVDIDQEEDAPYKELDDGFGRFVSALGPKLHTAQKQLSAAVVAWNSSKIVPVIDQFDFLNVMAYDFQRPWASSSPVQAASYEDARTELEAWLAKGAARTQLVLGVPLYGFRWSAGADVTRVTYQQIIDELGQVPTQDQVTTKTATITLNAEATIRAKAQLAKSDYGGLMLWELGQDAPCHQSLLQVVNDVFNHE